MDFFRRLFRFGSFHVAAGILFSRIFGLLRERFLTLYLGTSWEADALRAAVKIPNLLQNLLGEAAFSASFVPVYSALDQQKKTAEARALAILVFRFMLALSALGVCIGVLVAPILVDTISPGFEGERRELAIRLVRILFPGAGFLVLSAWCLAVLNSHRQYFLSYAAPAIWNLSVIGSLLVAEYLFHSESLRQVAVIAGVGFSIGGVAQLLIQVPKTLGWIGTKSEFSAEVVQQAYAKVKSGFLNTLVARGAVQIGGFIDIVFASLFPAGAVTCLSVAQTLMLLPLGLFGSSLAVPQLTEASRSSSNIDVLKASMVRNINRVYFLGIPTFFGFVFLGDDLIRLLFQGGQFSHTDTQNVWLVLVALSFGLVVSLLSRLLTSSILGFGDTIGLRNIVVSRIMISSGLSLVFLFFPPYRFEGPAAVSYVGWASSIGAIVEFTMVYLRLKNRWNIRISFIRPSLIFLAISSISVVPSLWLRLQSAETGVWRSVIVLALFGILSAGLGALYLRRVRHL